MPLHKTTEDKRLQLKRPQAEMQDGSMREESHYDYRELYSFSKKSGSGSSRSLSSHTTNRSSATCPVSNTTTAKEEKKFQKRKFRAFANWLMKFLERKDPRVFGAAQEVIKDCERRKERGEAGYESVTDSLKKPLREVVGRRYWREAQFHVDSLLFAGEPSLQRIQASSSDSDSSLENMNLPAVQYCDSGLSGQFARQSINRRPPPPPLMEVSPFAMTDAWNLGEEKKIRRERFYMLLRVLMKYLETRDHDLYLKAKAAINECVERNDKKEGGFENLSTNIKRAVKQVVGDSNWRRAESYLAKGILQQAITDETEEQRCRNQQALTVISRPVPHVFHQEPYPAQETVNVLSQKVGEDEESTGEVQEFFVNVCQVFSSSAKRTIEEQTNKISTTTASFCLPPADEDIDVEPMCFAGKRRRLQASSLFAPYPPRL